MTAVADADVAIAAEPSGRVNGVLLQADSRAEPSVSSAVQ